MIAAPPLPATDRDLAARLSRWARTEGGFTPYPLGGGYRNADRLIHVGWDRGELTVDVASGPSARMCRAVAEVTSARAVIDILYALDVVPVQMCSAYPVGLREGRQGR